MSELDEYLKFAKRLAEDAGKIMLKYFRTEGFETEIKEDLSPVTLADKEINSMVIARVKQKHPDHGVLGEEESYNLDKENLWIVDPIDGTLNFALGLPVFAFSLAFVVSGIPKVAVVYDPNTKRLFWAQIDGGAFENGKQIKLSPKDRQENLVISSWVVGGINGSCFSTADVDGKLATVFGKRGGFSLFDLPIAYVLPLIGAGSFDACITSVINPWDLAAGCLIAKEAGANATDIFGEEIPRWDKPIKGVLVAAPDIHNKLLDIIQPIVNEYK